MTVPSPWTGIDLVTAGGQPLRVARREGDGDLPPLVLIGGFTSSIEVLEPLVTALHPGSTVIAFDPPGIGGSPGAQRPYRLGWLAAVLAELLDGLGHQEADVLGVSWGGALAQQFAIQERTRCRRLVLVSTGPATIVRPSGAMLRTFVGARPARELVGDLYGGKVRTDPSLARMLGRGPGASGRGALHQQLAVLGWTSLPNLRSMRQPTLVLAGDDDPLVPMVNARILHRLLPQSTLRVFHDGHLGLLTSAGDLAPVIEAFRAS